MILGSNILSIGLSSDFGRIIGEATLIDRDGIIIFSGIGNVPVDREAVGFDGTDIILTDRGVVNFDGIVTFGVSVSFDGIITFGVDTVIVGPIGFIKLPFLSIL